MYSYTLPFWFNVALWLAAIAAPFAAWWGTPRLIAHLGVRVFATIIGIFIALWGILPFVIIIGCGVFGQCI